MGVVAFAPGELVPRQVPPLREERVTFYVGVDERERKAQRAVGGEGLGVDPFAAADHDLARQRVGDGKGLRK